MTEEGMLKELRTIRTLLAFDKEEKLQSIYSELDNKHKAVLEQLSYEDWTKSTTFQSDLAEDFDVSSETIRTKCKDLLEYNLVRQRGQGAGTEYRKSGLFRAIELVVI